MGREGIHASSDATRRASVLAADRRAGGRGAWSTALGALAPRRRAPTARARERPWTVSLGDSYISGEAGRWAGNTNESSSKIDALGLDRLRRQRRRQRRTDRRLPPLEVGRGLHRRRRQRREPRVLGGQDLQLQPKAARSSPGIDFYNSGGKEGQALMLQHFAAAHDVKLVAVSIGGNNFNFASIVQTCVEDWLLTPEWWPAYCSEESSVTNNFTLEQRREGEGRNHDRDQERRAGDDQRRLLAARSTRSSCRTTRRRSRNGSGLPLLPERLHPPDGRRLRLLEQRRQLRQRKNAADDRQHRARRRRGEPGCRTSRRWNWRRPSTGAGCARKASACSRKRACPPGRAPEPSTRREWINQIRTVTAIFPPYEIQEDIHPNYWGQLALRNCLTQAYNGGAPKGGTCTISGTGLNSAGEPNMSLH